MHVLETERLVLRRLTPEDAAFILELVNDPDWLRHIGDKGVRTHEDACTYILDGPVAMYRRLGFGLYGVILKDRLIPIGICGLIKRDSLEDVDIGFAFLPQYRGQGYASEAAAATLAYGRDVWKLPRIVAIVSPGNTASEQLLERLGFAFERTIHPSENETVRLFALHI